MSLTMRLRAHQHDGRAAGIEADLGIFGDGAGGLLDRVHHGDPPQLAARAGGVGARRVAGQVRGLDGQVHVLREVAGIVIGPERRLVGEGGGGNEVAAAQLDRVDAEFLGGGLDGALDQVDRFRPPGAPIRRGRIGVGQHRVDRDVRGLDVVDAGHGLDLPERRQQLPVGGDVGADAGQHVQAQAEDPAIRIQSERDLAHVVAAVLVGQHRLGALAAPLHRPAQLLRGPEHQPVVDILPALDAEPAADILHQHAHLALGYPEDVVGEHVAHAVRVVHVGVERVAILARVIGPDRAARLHVLRVHAGDDVATPHDIGRGSEGRVGCRAVTPFGGVGDVVGVLVPHQRRVGACSGADVGDGRQCLVRDLHELCRVLRLGERIGDHHRDGIADITRAVGDERRALRREHRRSVTLLAWHVGLGHPQPVGGVVGARVDRADARRARRRGRIDGNDPRMRVGRTHEDRPELEGQDAIVLITPLAGQQAHVLEPPHGLANAELHALHPQVRRNGLRHRAVRSA